MDLRSHNPYWLLRHGILNTYPSLAENISTEIVIMGGGISGALTAWHLQQAGFRVVVVDRRHIGMGSTAASTSLLQYEIDTPLRELIGKIGEKHAVKSYLSCLKAIDDIEVICHRLGEKKIFQRKPSLQFASFKKHVDGLKQEFQLRKKNGISLQWLEEKDILDKYGFRKPAGLLSKDGAEVDAYYLTHVLLTSCLRRGLQVYDHTEIIGIRHTKRGVELVTDSGKKIKARKLVIACGYESQRYIPFSVQQLRSTYAIASEPFSLKDFWYKNSLIWETHDPYIYLRTTNDRRILMGGKDIEYSDPARRDELLSAKARSLEQSFSKLFPDLRFKTDFRWAGTFASTKDGLPYIGSIRQRPHTYFALGFGGNGTTFSIIAAQVIRDILRGKKNEGEDIFSFNR
jgi:glycine/D-amino acid oxidase-like deaminating enzyme